MLWRTLLGDVPPQARTFHRAQVHRDFCEAAAALTARPAGIPRRLFVVGISSLPRQVLEALRALSHVTDIYLLVTNPCRFYWGDIVSEREALQREARALARKRHRPHPELDELPRDELHLRANPLLAGWGGQGRDFIAALYECETAQGFDIDHDLFLDWADGPDASLLTQVQQDILDMAHPRERLNADGDVRQLNKDDRSLQFVSAHSALREVEILRDQLLDAFEQEPTLKPRDIMVMVPDIDRYAPLIDAVFGQYPRQDSRWIPYSIADRQASAATPLLACALQLLSLPTRRLTVSELLSWLEIPAFRHRFGIQEAALPRIARWVTGSGVRWGLNSTHRELLGLPALSSNTWQFGLERMLLGYAVGGECPTADDAFSDGAVSASGADDHDSFDSDSGDSAYSHIEPYDEVQGLDAELVGRLMDIIDTLDHFARTLATPCSPVEWAERLSQLYEAVFAPRAADEFDTRQRLTQAVYEWLDQCDAAEFNDPVALLSVQHALRAIIDEEGMAPRFLGGSVNFATLIPMRAIPFRYTWLLGMNDGDYPRVRPAQDFDLMAVHPQPGDRSRRDDDRYLMLEALLATRTRLTCSWVGQDQRGGGARSPSILVSELRDAIAQGWRLPGDALQEDDPDAGERVLAWLTQQHPLQPFSRRYLTGDDPRVFTYDEHWAEALRQAQHTSAAVDAAVPRGTAASVSLPAAPVADSQATLEGLIQLLRSPPRVCLAARLGVHFRQPDEQEDDAEPFALDGIAAFTLRQRLLDSACSGEPLDKAIARAQRAGMLPLLGFGDALVQQLLPRLASQLSRWQRMQGALEPVPCQQLCREWQDITGQVRALEAVLGGLTRTQDGQVQRWEMAPSHFGDRFASNGQLALCKAHRLFENEMNALLACLALQAPVQPCWVFEDRALLLPPISPAEAAQRLRDGLTVLEEGWQRPLPVERSLALDYLAGSRPEHDALPAEDPHWHSWRKRYEEENFLYGKPQQALRDRHPLLRECWPTFDDLLAHGFAPLSRRLYGALAARLADAEQRL